MNILLDAINENITTSFYTMDEAIQSEIAEKVLDKVFSATINKYNKVNFFDIEKTRGDISKLKYYKNLIECVNTLKEIDAVTHKLPAIGTIEKAINNLIKLKPEFEKSFRVQNNCGIMIYNLITYSIMESVSYLIATSINFTSETEIIISNTDSDKLLVSSLDKFNVLSEDGTIYKFVNEVEKEIMNESIGTTLANFIKKVPVKKMVGITLVSIAILGLLKSIVPLVQNTVYYIYKVRHKLSETAQVQADMLELNISILKEDGKDPKIIAEQEKWVERFKKYAEKFALDSDKAKRDSDMDIKNDKVDINSLVI